MDSATDRRLEASTQERSADDRAAASVPASYAERAMNSLMSLHSGLIAEKERTLDLTRRLMEARQGRAELESYVRLLEAEVARLGGPDLRDAHDGRGDALGRASERILDALRRSPEAPAPEPPAVAAEAPPVAAEAPAPPPRPARAQAHRVPRPPRPSRRYRTKITAPAEDTAAEAREAPGAAAEAREAPRAAAGGAPGADPQDDDGWRQW